LLYPFLKTFDSLKKANLVSLMVACAVLAVVVVLGAVGAITWMTGSLINIKIGWLDTLVHWTIGALTGIGGWFMLPALTVLISGIFQETAIQRVEHIYYPNNARSGTIKFWPDFWHDIQFTLLALCLNILILPLYLFGSGFVVSIFLNSYLLGREFFESAAGYHVGKARAKELGRQNRKAVYGGGFAITLTTLIPLLNLFVPILAIVWMVHAYHKECEL
jgi:CysZ protein